MADHSWLGTNTRADNYRRYQGQSRGSGGDYRSYLDQQSQLEQDLIWQRYEQRLQNEGYLLPPQFGTGYGQHATSAQRQISAQDAARSLAMTDLGYTDILPDKSTAPEVQHLANRRAAEYNQRLLREAAERGRAAYGQIPGLMQQGRDAYSASAGRARGALMQGLSTLQSYRPGGAASLASPYFSQLAGQHQAEGAALMQSYGQQASFLPAQAGFELTQAQLRQILPPDLMFRYDEANRRSAERSAERDRMTQMIMSGANLISSFLKL